MERLPLNSIDAALDELFGKYWLDGLAAQLSGLHREHGQPAAPAVAFGRWPEQLPFLPYERVGALNGYETQAVEAFNSGVKAAYRCIDVQFEGLMTALGNTTKGSDQWAAYSQAARAAIEKYFSGDDAFDDFDAYILSPAKQQLGL